MVLYYTTRCKIDMRGAGAGTRLADAIAGAVDKAQQPAVEPKPNQQSGPELRSCGFIPFYFPSFMSYNHTTLFNLFFFFSHQNREIANDEGQLALNEGQRKLQRSLGSHPRPRTKQPLMLSTPCPNSSPPVSVLIVRDVVIDKGPRDPLSGRGERGLASCIDGRNNCFGLIFINRFF